MLCKACNIGKRNDYNNVPVGGLRAADWGTSGCSAMRVFIDGMGVRTFPVLIQESPGRQVAEHPNSTASGNALPRHTHG